MVSTTNPFAGKYNTIYTISMGHWHLDAWIPKGGQEEMKRSPDYYFVGFRKLPCHLAGSVLQKDRAPVMNLDYVVRQIRAILLKSLNWR